MDTGVSTPKASAERKITFFAAGAELRFKLSPEAFRFFGFGGLFRRRPLEHRQGEPKRTGPDGQDAALPADVRAQRAEQDEGQQHQ